MIFWGIYVISLFSLFTSTHSDCGSNAIEKTFHKCECKSGYFGDPLSSCTRDCGCSSSGSVDRKCQRSGQCECKPNYRGDKCDECDKGFHGYPDCKACECSIHGSNSTLCKNDGQCPCFKNYEGKKCDVCKPGYYMYPKCLECDCSLEGTNQGLCNKYSTTCYCNVGFDSQKCDQCALGYYGHPQCLKMAKVLVVTGYPQGQKTEVIDLANPKRKCNLLADTSAQWGAVGGLIENLPLICGGFDGRDVLGHCFIFGNPNRKIALLEKRGDAASVVLNQTRLWIVGGFTSSNSKATEFASVSRNSADRGPDLPLAINRFCMIEYLPSAIYIIGGIQERSISNNVWIVNPNANFSFSEGPPLQVKRFAQTCGKFMVNGKLILVVAGGYAHDTVELLDPLSDQGWIRGPKLPYKIRSATLVTSPDGKGIVIIGGFNVNANQYSTALLELRGPSIESLEWKVMDQKLQYDRRNHVAFPIPDEMTSCN